ncbi:response regulator [bacterium]|nr:response regulator [bacterium]
MPPIRILIADDQVLLREGVAALLSMFPDLEIVAKAESGREAVEMVERHLPDVVLMDVRMPDMNGIAATHKIHARFPDVRVIILTTFDNDEYVYESLESGAAGYLLKNADPEWLAGAIRSVHNGQSILDPSVTQKVIRRMVHLSGNEPWEPILTERLTDRERDVVTLMAAGSANAEIAEKLSLAEGTVKNYVSQIIAKLNARDRAHAVRLAVEWGLLCDSVQA